MSGALGLNLWLLQLLLVNVAVLTDAVPNEPYLLYSNLTNINSIDLNETNIETNNEKNVETNVVSGLHSTIALDVDRVGQKIYYGEHSQGDMYRVNINGTNKELVLSKAGRVEGIAIDWVTRLIYWTAYTSEKIEVATLEGKHRKILINTGLEYPRGIALDPQEGLLFWSDWGVVPRIERCTLAGGNRRVLVINNIEWPNGITVDYINKRLYWIDAKYDTITSIDYNGGQRTKVFEDTSMDVSQYHGFDLDFLNGILFWTDWLANGIFGVRNETIVTNITIPSKRSTKGVMGLVVVDLSRQPTVINRCGSNNGGCQQLCLLEPNGFKCACGIGFKLADDGKSCDDAFKCEFIMFADGGAGKIYQLQTDSVNVEPVEIEFAPGTKISRPIALEFDPVEDRIYWTDVTLKFISRAFRNGTGYETLFADKVGTADGLTVDLAGRNLYWTSTTYDTIEVSRLDGSYRRVLINSDLREPRDIIVDPVAGYMYWTDWGIPKIERAYMDGSNRSVLVNNGIRWPNGLTIDHVNKKLYWADAFEDSIEFIYLDSGERDVVINEKFIIFGFLYRASNQVNHPFGLTLLHERLYWTDWQTNSVYSANKNTGANITRLATGLGKPMDIHAYNCKPKQDYRKSYTFSFPKTGSNFTCIRNRSCPAMPDPPPCPAGYSNSREDSACGVYCRKIVGYRYRCQCQNWRECAVKQSYRIGCATGYYSSFRVRECIQVVRPGRCPYMVTEGSRQACANDEECPSDEKCCNGICAKPASIWTHSCQRNNGGCEQLCLAIPGGYRCACENNFMYNEALKRCVEYVAPPTLAPTTPTASLCPPLKPPGNGTISGSCDRTFLSMCYFKCNDGFKLKGSRITVCVFTFWSFDLPTCVEINAPVFSNCPQNISVATDPGVATKKVNWIVPTATDHEGEPANVTVTPAAYVPPVKLRIGKIMIEYKAMDDEFRTAYCSFSVEVKDKEPPTLTCPQDITTYTDKQDDEFVTWVSPTFKDNSDTPIIITRKGTSTSSKYPVGRTTITYSATDAAGLTASCSFNINIINVCSTVRCGRWQTCKLKDNIGKCVCNDICTKEYKQVCGADGKTYSNQCDLQLAECTANGIINVIKEGKCGCEDLNIDNASSILICSNDKNSIKCEVICREGYENALPDFLQLRCEEQRWIRRNNLGKYVPIKKPPKCYQTQPQQSTENKCLAGSEFTDNQVCVQCPPGSFQTSTQASGQTSSTRQCKECDVNYYQDSASQINCKPCSTFINMTSTTTGADDCFFDYATSVVKISFESENVDLRKIISEGLTAYCKKATCSFADKKTSRRKRAKEDIVFKEEHVVIVSQKSSNKQVVASVFVLDPTSTALVPDKALSAKELSILLEMMSKHLPFPLHVYDSKDQPSSGPPSSGPPSSGPPSSSRSTKKSNGVVIVIVVIVVLVLFGLAVVAFLYIHRRKQKRHLELNEVPPVQFTPDEGMQIGPPSVVPDHIYENGEAIENGIRHGFVNQVYAEVNPPPPPYQRTPFNDGVSSSGQPKTDPSHIYETPGNPEAGALPTKEPLPGDGIVELIPPKQIGFRHDKSTKDDFPVQYFHKRATGNDYTTPRGAASAAGPRYEQPVDAEASLRLEPPPKYDDVQLQFIREKAASGILPNAPKKKKAAAPIDDNANQQDQESSQSELSTPFAAHIVEDATSGQSES